MPQRFLRPGITTSLRFNRVPWIAQSFYTRLITLVDDFGRYEANHQLLKSHCFPFGDDLGTDIPLTTIADICCQLSAVKLVFFYASDDKEYLQLTKWKERTRSESRYPEPDSEQLLAFDSKCSPPKPVVSVLSHKPSPIGGGVISPSMQAMLDKQNLERIEAEIKRITGSVDSHVELMPEDRAKRKKLKEQAEILKKKLNFSV